KWCERHAAGDAEETPRDHAVGKIRRQRSCLIRLDEWILRQTLDIFKGVEIPACRGSDIRHIEFVADRGVAVSDGGLDASFGRSAGARERKRRCAGGIE